MGKSCKQILIFVLLIVASVGHRLASAAEPDHDYRFPFADPLIATLAAATQSTHVPYKVLDFAPRGDRRNIPLVEKRNTVALGLFMKNANSPVAFVVAGAGGSGLSGSSLSLGGELFNLGYTVVTLPDPVSWSYTVSVSESAVPGYIPDDSKEYYKFMQEVVAFLKTQVNLNPKSYSVVGYSLGGLLSAYVAREDDLQHVFNFNRILIINPAIDLEFGLKTLDRYFDAGQSMTQDRKDFLMGGVISIGADIIGQDVTPQFLKSSLKRLGVSKQELKWLIGQSFRSDLATVIFTGQQVHDRGILKQYADEFHKNARENEAYQISFTQYMEQFVLPSLGRVDAREVIDSSNLYSLKETLQTNKNIFVMENEDDIIIHQGDVEFLKENLHDRLYLYPLGGHIGNLSYQKNQDDLSRIMKLEAY